MNINKIKKYIRLAAIYLLLTPFGGWEAISSCSKVEIPTYDTAYTALNIWVGTSAGAVYESTTYNYSYAYDEGSVTFYAQISGMPVDYDRTFELEPYGGDSALIASTIRTEVDTIKAGKISGTFKVYFNSQKLNPDSLFNKSDGVINFRMKANKEFSIGTEDHQSFTVILKNYLAKPDNWDAANFPRQPISKYFGTYSQVKYKFMIEKLGLIDFEINYNTSTSYNPETNVISTTYAIYLKQVMQQALNEYNESHDVPLTDEYGIPVTF